MAACVSSLPCKERAKKPTGLPSSLRVVASATSDASASTSIDMVSSMAATKASTTIFFKLSNVVTASGDRGNDLQLVSGLMRLENSGIH